MKNNAVKRFFIIALTICMISGHVCASAAAYDRFEYPRLYESQQMSATDVIAKYVDPAELRAYLFESFKECPDGKIDISRYKIPAADVEALKTFIWREMPECFHVNGLRIYKNDIITGVGASYKYAETKEQYLSMLAECEERAAVLLDGIIGNDDLSDVEKALLIHDRLAVNCTYCEDKNVGERYTMYGALVFGLAVCDGYTRAYAYMLRLAGIESVNCSSEALNHAWNLVLIDGNYYHIDVTWDDPSIANGSRSVAGAVKHNNFMLSNDGIKANKHNADDYYTPAYDNKYDGYFWKSSDTEFQLVGKDLYYFDNAEGELMRLNDDRKSGSSLCRVSDRWWASDHSYYWKGNYSKLSSDGYSLFFSTTDTVYVYDVNRGRKSEVFKPELTDGDLIYGFTYSDGYLVCDINDRPSGQGDRLRQVKQLYVPEGIAAKLTATTVHGDKQTVSAEIISNTGISGYYFGQKSEYTLFDIVLSDKSALEFTVSEPGDYYFVAFDKKGKSSSTASLSFCLVTLDANGGKVSCDKVLVPENTAFALPAAEMTDQHFGGWAETADAKTGATVLELTDPPLTKTLFAVWTTTTDITGEVKTVGNTAISFNILDADGNVISSAELKSGEFALSVTDEAVFIEITAPGHIGRIYSVSYFIGDFDEIKLDLVGDTNGDDELNNKDVTVLFRGLSSTAGMAYSDPCDVNADGETNNKDVALLFRFLSDPKTVLIPHSAVMY